MALSRIIHLFAAILCAAALCLFPGGAFSQDDKAVERALEIEETTRALSDIRDSLEDDTLEDVADIESRLRSLRDGSRNRLTPVVRELRRAEENQAALPPAPSEGEVEAQAIAERRERIAKRVSRLEGQRSAISANVDEASDLLAALSAHRVQRLYEGITKRGRTLLAPGLWADAWSSATSTVVKTADYLGGWSGSKSNGGNFAVAVAFMAGAFALAIFLFGPVHRWIRNGISDRIQQREPTDGRRVAVAGLTMTARVISGVVGGLLIMEAARSQGLLQAEGEQVAKAIWGALVAFLLVDGFTSGLFLASPARWRLANLDQRNGSRVRYLLLALVGVFGAKNIISQIGVAAGASQSFLRVVDGSAAIVVGVLLYFLCRRQLWRNAKVEGKDQQSSEPSKSPWRFVRRGGRVFGIAIIVGALAGYVTFADFVASRVYLLALILMVAWFIRAFLKEMIAWAERRLRSESQSVAHADDDDKTPEILRFWAGAAVDTILGLFLIPIVFILGGFGATAVRDFALRAFIGVDVGGARISLSSIAVAIATFVVILALTRVVQKGLQKGPLAHSHIDSGVQNSLITLVGYAGLVLAFFGALSVTTIDLSGLAIVAGALSVGIGFGLQSVVNNFVSGLILLFERPVKVGDWIVTTSGEGTVKKISVRSTEIETFDRSSIIIPNAELISSSVTNWTHKNRMGRVIVPIGVAYNSDPEQVRDILLKCAEEHPLTVSYPEPFVTWQDFGASSLDFDLRAFVRDISKGLQVRTELRFAIFKALKEAGVEIPFPQQDIYVKSLPDSLVEAASVPDAQEPEAAQERA